MAKLIWITPEAEDNILYCARVSSNDQNSKNTKLLNYCIKHGHWSIFEMANMCIEIETSRAISAQILRHRSFSFQEFSQRYSKVAEIMEYPARSQDLKNRQNSIDDMAQEDKDWFLKAQQDIAMKATNLYQQALDKGVAKEQARMLLPMSSKTKLYMNGTVRSWIHYLNLRCGNGTQLEHQQIAEDCKAIFSEQLPIVAQSLGWLE
jgi:thymidylate synthase (FAD)